MALRRVAAWLCLGMLAAGCSGEKPKAREVQAPMVRDVNPLLRETIHAEATFLNTEPVLVSGYGIVVGLRGTGGEPNLPEPIAATLEREMQLRGISGTNRDGSAISGKTPREILRDPNVAVVLVQAAIPPGSPKGKRFDAYVTALNASSLDGGTLWTTELRVGDATTFGRAQERVIAAAGGPLFVNPFADPGRESEGPSRKSGRVLGGGVVTNPVGIALMMGNTSHARARSIVSAINTRFPGGRGDSGPIARGVSGQAIELSVPARYRDKPAEFLEVVKYLRFDATPAPVAARRYIEALKAEPGLSSELGAALLALGDAAVPFVRELYDHPEPVPQLTGLMVGAKLNDARSSSFLRELAKSGSGVQRLEAIALLGEIDAGPSVDMTLREIMGEPELSIRVAAYEALAGRAERLNAARRAAVLSGVGAGTHREALTGWGANEAAVQGVQRRVVAGKFLVDIVPVGEPLIYVTQQDRPRIVLFGEGMEIANPAVIPVWEDRLMIKRDAGESTASILWRGPGMDRATTHSVRATIPDLIEFLAREAFPGDTQSGLNLTYSEVIGVLDAVQRAGGTAAAMTTERNKLKADLLTAAAAGQVRHRPETPADREVVVVREPASLKGDAPGADDTPRIVPIVPANPEKPKKN